jgi:hypothetical protein
MNKFFTLIAFMALSISSLFAQNATRAVGDKSFDIGVGFKTVSAGFSTSIPPIDASFEYTILDFEKTGTLSVGGLVSFGMQKYSNVPFSFMFAGPLACYRFPIINDLDLFGKFAVGYYSFSTSDGMYRDYLSSSGFSWAAYVGATYYFSDKFGIGFQIGNGVSTAELHLTIRL